MIYDMIVIYLVDSNGLLKIILFYYILYLLFLNDIFIFFILKLYFFVNENL